MRVAIISDIHDNIPNLQKVLDYCAKNSVEKLICCGDLATVETLDFLNEHFPGEIFYTFGNMDTDHLRDMEFSGQYKHTHVFRYFGEAIIEKHPVAFVHYPEEARKLCETGKYEFVFYGHTHDPWEDIITVPAATDTEHKQCKMLNPGNVANQKNPPTFAIWNTQPGTFDLVLINPLS